jgi:hypothetical protein
MSITTLEFFYARLWSKCVGMSPEEIYKKFLQVSLVGAHDLLAFATLVYNDFVADLFLDDL